MANVKITALTNIGSNILYSALIPIVNMTGTPVTQQGNIQILGNYILSGAGSANFAPAYLSNLAYSVVNAAQPNITSVGTLTSLAVTGNVAANLFIGDGGLLTNVSSAGTSIANGTSNVSIPAAGGNILFARGGTSNVVVITGTGANIAGTLNATGNANTGNIGATNGVFTTVSGNISATNLNVSGNVTSNLLPNANVTYNLGSSTQRWNDIWLSNSTIYIGDSSISAGSGNSIIFSGPVQADGNITSNAGSNVTVITETGNTTHAWSFGADGNLTLPNNSFAINYANGSQVQLSSANIGNFAFTSNTMSLNGIASNLYIQNDNTATARIIIPRSTDANVVELTLQNFGDSGVHVLTGNAGIEEHIWHFDSTGNFNLPGNTIMEGYQLFVGPGASILPNIANATLVISSNSEAYIQAVINNVSDIGSADWIAQGHYGDDDGGYADFGFNSASHEDPEYSLTGPGDGYILVQGYYSGQGPAIGGGNLILATGVEGLNRDIIFGMGGYTSANMFAKMSDANTALEFTRPGTILRFGDNSTLGEILGAGANTFGITATANSNVLIKTSHFDGAFSTEYVWQFGENGTFIPPTLEVDLHNGGNQLGQVLQFGDPGYQAIITGPTPEANVNAQRLIIQGQRGNGTGEGGDVYVWGGDADTNGGDIKIYAGDADNVSAGSGGYVNLAGGDGFDNGGDIDITGGSSANGTGGDIFIDGGSGELVGGTVSIQAGYSANGQGGTVQITGGASGNGTGSYGNVEIGSGTHAWLFDNTGNLTLPGNAIAINYADGNRVFGNVTFRDEIVIGTGTSNLISGLYLAPSSSSANADMYLRVRGNINDEPTHIHFDTGNNQYYNQYIGDDNKYILLANTGNIVINSNDGVGNSALWIFGNNGNLTLPEGSIVTNNIPLATFDILFQYDDLVWSGNTLTFTNASSTYMLGVLALMEVGDTIILGVTSTTVTGVYTGGGAGTFTVSGTGAGQQIAQFTLPNRLTSVNGIKLTTNSKNYLFTEAGVTQSPVLTVDTLPSSQYAIAGFRAFVSDANLVPVGNFGAIVGNSGSNTVCVWCDGTNWRIG